MNRSKTPRPAPTTHAELVRDNERLRIELEVLRRSRRGRAIADVCTVGLKFGLTGLFVWLSIRELAGQVTIVNAAVDVCASLPHVLEELAPKWWLQLGTSGVLFIMLLVHKRLRSTNASLSKRLGDATQKWESHFDPDRSTSGLGNDGQTNRIDVP